MKGDGVVKYKITKYDEQQVHLCLNVERVFLPVQDSLGLGLMPILSSHSLSKVHPPMLSESLL